MSRAILQRGQKMQTICGGFDGVAKIVGFRGIFACSRHRRLLLDPPGILASVSLDSSCPVARHLSVAVQEISMYIMGNVLRKLPAIQDEQYSIRMAKLLYSTNCFLKLLIQERYHGDVHYVWCSEAFDSKKLAGYTSAAMVGASSDPASIMRELKRDVETNDLHSAKIESQRASFIARAMNDCTAGTITSDNRDDITYLSDKMPITYWRPLVYIIPMTSALTGRVTEVPAKSRASFGPEFIILDLHRSEFDIIEP
jgi:hypothetical protein